MANQVFDQWIPVEYSPDVIQRVMQTSAVLTFGQRVPMSTESRSTPRSGGLQFGGIGKGGNYGQDASTVNDSVYLYAQKYGSAAPIAEEDLNDSLADIVNAKNKDAGTSFAKLFDNHCLAVTQSKAVATMQDGSHPQFDSLYYLLTQADANTGYTANANLTQTATGAPQVTYANLRAPLAQVEAGDYFEQDRIVVIAHPRFADVLRSIVDSQNRPIFNESTNGTAGGGQGGVPTLFGHELHWSLGARTSANPTPTPNGNPLLIVCNRDYLLVGDREPLSIQNIDGNTGLGALSDTAYLKYRARRAFAPGHENAFAILEWRQ